MAMAAYPPMSGQSVTQRSFPPHPAAGPADTRPTSAERFNKPHARTFRTAVLPTGDTINVSAVKDADGGFRTAREPMHIDPEEMSFGMSSQRVAYHGVQQEEWQRTNTQRFGLTDQIWVAKGGRTSGIVPAIPDAGLSPSRAMVSSTQDTYRNPFPLLDRPSSRAGHISQGGAATLSPEDREELATVFKGDAAAHVLAWINECSGFEGEVIKRLLRDVAAASRQNTPAYGVGSANASPSRPRTGRLQEVSEEVGRAATPKESFKPSGGKMTAV